METLPAGSVKLEDYAPVVGQDAIDDLKFLAEKIGPKVIQNINSTAVGGGVAEILNRMVPLMKQLGLAVRWDFIKGGEEFFSVTKKIHNMLHDRRDQFTQRDIDVFVQTSRENIGEVEIAGDIVEIHDPQPIALIEKKGDNKWIWRCHVDISRPSRDVWDFLKPYIERYDAAIFSASQFSPVLPIRQFLISPSIDPLSDKNKDLPAEVIDGVLQKYGIETDKPLLVQISRFDRLKDPLGVIEVYKMVKRYNDCRLVLAGGGAADDPEGARVLEEVRARAAGDPDIYILLLEQNDIEVNALQRAATVVLQKSIKEGFGLTVSEALWKAKPVVASNVGGIPLQIRHKYTGLLCYSNEGAAFAVRQLLNSPEWAASLGETGKEHVRHNFLLTRNIREYLLLFLAVYTSEDRIYL